MIKKVQHYFRDKVRSRLLLQGHAPQVLLFSIAAHTLRHTASRLQELNMKKMATVSRAGAGLLRWVITMKDYYAGTTGVDRSPSKTAMP